MIGFGNLGRALRRLLVPFGCAVRVYDPWLPDSALREHGVQPAGLAETLRASTVLFVLATVTDESERLLGPAEFDAIPFGARVVLVSRAAVVDFDALLDRVQSGRIVAAIDVWPEEPLAADHRARTMDGLVLSAHRAGGVPSAFLDIGERVLDDLRLVNRGLPPVRMQVAARELVGAIAIVRSSDRADAERSPYLRVWRVSGKIILRRLVHVRGVRGPTAAAKALRYKGLRKITALNPGTVPVVARMARAKQSARRVDAGPWSSSTWSQRRSNSSTTVA